MGECIYANILDDISMGIIGLDITRKEVFFQNKAAVDIFKSTIKPKDYHALASFLLPNTEDNSLLSNLSNVRTLSYGNRFIGCTVYRISEIYLWIYVSDVTEKVRLDSIAEAVNTMNNLGFIFSGIRHELGNPINSIKTTVTVFRNNINSCSRETAIEYIDRVLEDINRVEGLLTGLRNFSMYETPALKDMHIPSFMNSLVTMAERDFQKDQIRIKTIFRPEAEYGYADPRALHHVMLNILKNSADALIGREAPEIIISVLKAGDRIVIKVKDNGCGIPEEQKKHLFKPFSTTKTKGTGLGLVIVKKMLAKAGGTVEIESRENVGTVVTINLPTGLNSSLRQ